MATTYTTCTLRGPVMAALDQITDRLLAAGITPPNRGQLVELAVLTLLAEWDQGAGSHLVQSGEAEPMATLPVLSWTIAAQAEYQRDGVKLSLAHGSSVPSNLDASDHVFARIRGNLAERVAS